MVSRTDFIKNRMWVMSGPPSDPEIAPQLPAPIVPADRLLTAAEFHRLADVPPEIEWFANIRNRHTRRSYENAIGDFMRFAGIVRPEEFRTVTRAHVIAWRDSLAERDRGGATVRHRLAALSSLFEYLCEKNAVTHNPVKGVKRPEGRNRRRQDAGARRPSGAQPAHRTRRGNHQGETRPCDPVDLALSRAAPRGTVQAQDQGF